uniref:Uncharacterized protein n=1 Tax=Plectus sambesii TaxID=2011161 RepID=A0A914UN03_9BILA
MVMMAGSSEDSKKALGSSSGITSTPSPTIIPPFKAFNPDVDDWTSYQDHLFCHFEAHGISTEIATPHNVNIIDRHKVLLLSWIGKATFDILAKSIFITMTPLDPTIGYENLLDALGKHFDTTKSIMTAAYDFYNCRQKLGQSFTEWKTELCALAGQCAFTTGKLKDKPLDHALQDMYVMGTCNPKIRQKLLDTKDTDLNMVEWAVVSAEMRDHKQKHLSPEGQAPLSSIYKMTTNPNNQPPGGKRPQFQCSPPQQKSQPCNSCGKSTHKHKECWH